MQDVIKEISRLSSVPLLRVSRSGPSKIMDFTIKCGELEDYNFADIRYSQKYQQLFAELAEMDGPCLYYFEVVSAHLTPDIINRIRSYALSDTAKTVPSMRKRIPNSSILYVGKVKKNLWGRMIQHLGFYNVRKTQGLQLFHWAKDLNLDVKITVMEFENGMKELMPVLENALAKRLRPILGRHS